MYTELLLLWVKEWTLPNLSSAIFAGAQRVIGKRWHYGAFWSKRMDRWSTQWSLSFRSRGFRNKKLRLLNVFRKIWKSFSTLNSVWTKILKKLQKNPCTSSCRPTHGDVKIFQELVMSDNKYSLLLNVQGRVRFVHMPCVSFFSLLFIYYHVLCGNTCYVSHAGIWISLKREKEREDIELLVWDHPFVAALACTLKALSLLCVTLFALPYLAGSSFLSQSLCISACVSTVSRNPSRTP